MSNTGNRAVRRVGSVRIQLSARLAGGSVSQRSQARHGSAVLACQATHAKFVYSGAGGGPFALTAATSSSVIVFPSNPLSSDIVLACKISKRRCALTAVRQKVKAVPSSAGICPIQTRRAQ